MKTRNGSPAARPLLRTVRLLAKIVVAALVGVVILIAAATGYLETAAGHRRVVAVGGTVLRKLLPGITVGEISGNYFGHIDAKDALLRDRHGHFVASLARITVDYRIFSLLRRKVSASSVRIENPRFELDLAPDGSNNVEDLVVRGGQPEGPSLTGAPAWTVEVDHVEVMGGELTITHAGAELVTVHGLSLAASFFGSFSDQLHLRAHFSRLETRGSIPYVDGQRAVGLTLNGEGGFDMPLGGLPASLETMGIVADLHMLATGVTDRGQPTAVDVVAHGPIAAMIFDLRALTPNHADMRLRGRFGWRVIGPDYALEGRLLHVDPSEILPWLPRGDLNLHLTSAGKGMPPSPDAAARFDLDGDKSRFGEMDVGSLQLNAELHGQQWRLSALAARADDLHMAVRGHGDFTNIEAEVSAHLRPGAELEAHLEGSLRDRLVAQLALSAHDLTLAPVRVGELQLDVHAAMTAKALTGDGALRAGHIAINTAVPMMIEHLTLDARASGGLLSLSANVANPRIGDNPPEGEPIELSGEVPLQPGALASAKNATFQLHLATHGYPLRVLGSLGGLGDALQGTIDVSAELRGAANEPTATATIILHRVGYRGIDGMDGRIQLSCGKHQSELDGQAAGDQIGAWTLVARTPLGLADRGGNLLDVPFTLALDGVGLPVERLVTTASSAGAITGLARLHLEAQGRTLSPTAKLELATSRLRVAGNDIVDLTTNVVFSSASTTTDVEVQITHAGTVLLTATLKAAQSLAAMVRNVATTPAALRVQLPELALASLLSNPVQAKTMTATVLGDVRLDGTLSAPRGTASLLATDGPDTRLQLTTTADPGSANPLQAKLAAKHVNIAAFRRLLPGVTALGGYVDVHGSAAGSFASPAIEAKISLSDGIFSMFSLPTFRDVQMTIAINPEHVVLSNLALHSAGGSMIVDGRLDWHQFQPSAAELHMAATKFMLAYSGISGAYFTGGLDTQMTWGKGGIVGNIRLRPSTMSVPDIGDRRELQSLGPLADLHFTDADDVVGTAAHRSMPRLDVSLDADSLLLQGKELAVEVSTKLELITNDERQMLIRGKVTMSHGRVTLFDRSYNIDHAVALFGGSPDINPVVDVKLTRQFPQGLVTLTVSGTPRHPTLQLASDPAFERSQILALIMTGQADTQSSANTSLAVAGAVLSTLASTYGKKLMPKLGIDVLRFGVVGTSAHPSLVNSQTNTTASVEVGKNLTDRIYVGYARVFGATLGENADEARLEYRLTRRLMLQTEFGDAGVGGVDLFWTYRY